MTDSGHRATSSSGLFTAASGNGSLVSLASSSSSLSPDPAKLNEQKSSPKEIPSHVPAKSSFYGGDFVRAPMDARIRDTLALCDNIIASAITISAQSNNSTDQATAHTLDDCLFDLNIWVENVEASISGNCSDSLKVLDTLRGPAASSVQKVIGDLEMTFKDMSKDLTTTSLTLSEHFRGCCDRVKAWVDQLDKLGNELVREITMKKLVVHDALKTDHKLLSHKISVLCFDGGGIRSYSSLLVLQALMDEIRSILAHETASSQFIRPYEVFDYVFGSSSGGLIAIMLARLNMTDQQCLDTFQTHAETIFLSHKPLYRVFGALFTTKYSSKSIIRATKLVVGYFDPTPEGQKWKRNMFAAPNTRCRCGVIAYTNPFKDGVNGSLDDTAYTAYLDKFCILRTYNNHLGVQNPGPATDYQIWQVAQATVAAPTYFPPVKIDGEEFLDGGFGVNNPSQLASKELSTIHDTKDICLISFGSGRHRSTSKNRSSQLGRYIGLLRTAIELVTDTENVHRHMLDLSRQSDKFSYFRFDVPGLEHIAMDQLVLEPSGKRFQPGEERTITFIRARTQEYLKQAETRESIKSCAQMVVNSHRRQEISSPRSGQKPKGSSRRELKNIAIPRNNAFCGREEILERMYAHLRPQYGEVDSRLKTCILYGMPGIGKTQIAAEYCYRYRHDYDCIFWVRAPTEISLAKSYSSILELIGLDNYITDAVKATQMVNQWLSNTEVPWLLIIDNADDMDDMSRHIPASSQGSVILTSRRRDIIIPRSLDVEVAPFDSEAGARLLNFLMQSEDSNGAARELANQLGGHPLAIFQAAGYMKMTATTCSEYLELYKKRQLEFSDTSGTRVHWIHSLFETTLASLSSDARRLLECMAVMDPDRIPEELFLQDIEDVTIIQKFHVSRVDLLRYSLIQRQTSSQLPTYAVHRVLKLYILQDHTTDPQRYVDGFLDALRLIRGVIPRLQPYMHQRDIVLHRSTFAAYLPHVLSLNEAHDHCSRIEDMPEQNLDFAGLLSDVVPYLLQFAPVRPKNLVQTLCEKVIKIRSLRLLGLEHPDTLTSMSNLASTFQDQGRLNEAEELEVRVMDIRKRVLRLEHPDTLTSMANLAVTYWIQGRWKKAEELNVQVMEMRKRVLGLEHPSTLTSMSNLASTIWIQGRWKEAEELNMQVMNIRERELGLEHPDTLTSMANLALTFQNQGRWKEAEELNVQVMEMRKRVLGLEHPSTLTSMSNLALTYGNQGRWKEAEELNVQVMEMMEKVLGPEHPSRLTSMANLALTYRNQGRWKEAEELQAQELKICSRVLGEDHPDTLTSMSNLAYIYHAQGQGESIRIMNQVVKQRTKIIGANHPDTIRARETLEKWLNGN